MSLRPATVSFASAASSAAERAASLGGAAGGNAVHEAPIVGPPAGRSSLLVLSPPLPHPATSHIATNAVRKKVASRALCRSIVILGPVESLVAARAHSATLPRPKTSANTVCLSGPYCMTLDVAGRFDS